MEETYDTDSDLSEIDYDDYSDQELEEEEVDEVSNTHVKSLVRELREATDIILTLSDIYKPSFEQRSEKYLLQKRVESIELNLGYLQKDHILKIQDSYRVLKSSFVWSDPAREMLSLISSVKPVKPIELITGYTPLIALQNFYVAKTGVLDSLRALGEIWDKQNGTIGSYFNKTVKIKFEVGGKITDFNIARWKEDLLEQLVIGESKIPIPEEEDPDRVITSFDTTPLKSFEQIFGGDPCSYDPSTRGVNYYKDAKGKLVDGAPLMIKEQVFIQQLLKKIVKGSLPPGGKTIQRWKFLSKSYDDIITRRNFDSLPKENKKLGRKQSVLKLAERVRNCEDVIREIQEGISPLLTTVRTESPGITSLEDILMRNPGGEWQRWSAAVYPESRQLKLMQDSEQTFNLNTNLTQGEAEELSLQQLATRYIMREKKILRDLFEGKLSALKGNKAKRDYLLKCIQNTSLYYTPPDPGAYKGTSSGLEVIKNIPHPDWLPTFVEEVRENLQDNFDYEDALRLLEERRPHTVRKSFIELLRGNTQPVLRYRSHPKSWEQFKRTRPELYNDFLNISLSPSQLTEDSQTFKLNTWGFWVKPFISDSGGDLVNFHDEDTIASYTGDIGEYLAKKSRESGDNSSIFLDRHRKAFDYFLKIAVNNKNLKARVDTLKPSLLKQKFLNRSIVPHKNIKEAYFTYLTEEYASVYMALFKKALGYALKDYEQEQSKVGNKEITPEQLQSIKNRIMGSRFPGTQRVFPQEILSLVWHDIEDLHALFISNSDAEDVLLTLQKWSENKNVDQEEIFRAKNILTTMQKGKFLLSHYPGKRIQEFKIPTIKGQAIPIKINIQPFRTPTGKRIYRVINDSRVKQKIREFVESRDSEEIITFDDLVEIYKPFLREDIAKKLNIPIEDIDEKELNDLTEETFNLLPIISGGIPWDEQFWSSKDAKGNIPLTDDKYFELVTPLSDAMYEKLRELFKRARASPKEIVKAQSAEPGRLTEIWDDAVNLFQVWSIPRSLKDGRIVWYRYEYFQDYLIALREIYDEKREQLRESIQRLVRGSDERKIKVFFIETLEQKIEIINVYLSTGREVIRPLIKGPKLETLKETDQSRESTRRLLSRVLCASLVPVSRDRNCLKYEKIPSNVRKLGKRLEKIIYEEAYQYSFTSLLGKKGEYNKLVDKVIFIIKLKPRTLSDLEGSSPKELREKILLYRIPKMVPLYPDTAGGSMSPENSSDLFKQYPFFKESLGTVGVSTQLLIWLWNVGDGISLNALVPQNKPRLSEIYIDDNNPLSYEELNEWFGLLRSYSKKVKEGKMSLSKATLNLKSRRASLPSQYVSDIPNIDDRLTTIQNLTTVVSDLMDRKKKEKNNFFWNPQFYKMFCYHFLTNLEELIFNMSKDSRIYKDLKVLLLDLLNEVREGNKPMSLLFIKSDHSVNSEAILEYLNNELREIYNLHLTTKYDEKATASDRDKRVKSALGKKYYDLWSSRTGPGSGDLKDRIKIVKLYAHLPYSVLSALREDFMGKLGDLNESDSALLSQKLRGIEELLLIKNAGVILKPTRWSELQERAVNNSVMNITLIQSLNPEPLSSSLKLYDKVNQMENAIKSLDQNIKTTSMLLNKEPNEAQRGKLSKQREVLEGKRSRLELERVRLSSQESEAPKKKQEVLVSFTKYRGKIYPIHTREVDMTSPNLIDLRTWNGPLELGKILNAVVGDTPDIPVSIESKGDAADIFEKDPNNLRSILRKAETSKFYIEVEHFTPGTNIYYKIPVGIPQRKIKRAVLDEYGFDGCKYYTEDVIGSFLRGEDGRKVYCESKLGYFEEPCVWDTKRNVCRGVGKDYGEKEEKKVYFRGSVWTEYKSPEKWKREDGHLIPEVRSGWNPPEKWTRAALKNDRFRVSGPGGNNLLPSQAWYDIVVRADRELRANNTPDNRKKLQIWLEDMRLWLATLMEDRGIKNFKAGDMAIEVSGKGVEWNPIGRRGNVKRVPELEKDIRVLLGKLLIPSQNLSSVKSFKIIDQEITPRGDLLSWNGFPLQSESLFSYYLSNVGRLGLEYGGKKYTGQTAMIILAALIRPPTKDKTLGEVRAKLGDGTIRMRDVTVTRVGRGKVISKMSTSDPQALVDYDLGHGIEASRSLIRKVIVSGEAQRLADRYRSVVQTSTPLLFQEYAKVDSTTMTSVIIDEQVKRFFSDGVDLKNVTPTGRVKDFDSGELSREELDRFLAVGISPSSRVITLRDVENHIYENYGNMYKITSSFDPTLRSIKFQVPVSLETMLDAKREKEVMRLSDKDFIKEGGDKLSIRPVLRVSFEGRKVSYINNVDLIALINYYMYVSVDSTSREITGQNVTNYIRNYLKLDVVREEVRFKNYLVNATPQAMELADKERINLQSVDIPSGEKITMGAVVQYMKDQSDLSESLEQGFEELGLSFGRKSSRSRQGGSRQGRACRGSKTPISADLRKRCQALKIRLTYTRRGKRYYRSPLSLKKECNRKVNLKKKNIKKKRESKLKNGR